MGSKSRVVSREGKGSQGPKNQGQNAPTKEAVMENITQGSEQIVSQTEVTTNSPKTAKRANKLKNFKLNSQQGSDGRMLDMALIDRRTAKFELKVDDALRGETEVNLTYVANEQIDQFLPAVESKAKMRVVKRPRLFVDVTPVISANKDAVIKPLTHLNAKGEQSGNATMDYYLNANFEWTTPTLAGFLILIDYQAIGDAGNFKIFNADKSISANAHAVATNIKMNLDDKTFNMSFMSAYDIDELDDPISAITLEEWLKEREDLRVILDQCVANLKALKQPMVEGKKRTGDENPKAKLVLNHDGLEVAKLQSNH